MQIGRIDRVPPRQLWKHEEYGFTVWLERNIEVLAEAIDLPLEVVEREKRLGAFRVDLVAETRGGDLTIIENQLAPSNHDHLGKLVTYFSNLRAKVAVWVVTSGRPEHVLAVNWLNESTPADQAFFLVQLEGIRIGDSSPAPLFTLVAGPSEEAKAIGQEKKELAERHVQRLQFWEQLLERAEKMGVAHHSNRSPTKESWLATGAGKSGITWVYLIWVKEQSGVELYIDAGEADENEEILSELFRHKEEVEQTFGHALDWQPLEGRRACRVRYEMQTGGLEDEENWPKIQDEMIRAMDRLIGALEPHLISATRAVRPPLWNQFELLTSPREQLHSRWATLGPWRSACPFQPISDGWRAEFRALVPRNPAVI